LIAERKAGLAKWLSALLWSLEYQSTPAFLDFLNRPPVTEVLRTEVQPDVEDVLPSSLSRASAVEAIGRYIDQRESEPEAVGFVSSAYYPHWAATSNPPESLDYSKIGFLLFGDNSSLKFLMKCSWLSGSGFVTPNKTATLDWVADTASVLKRVVEAAKASNSGTRIILSIGMCSIHQYALSVL
jgi:chitinase